MGMFIGDSPWSRGVLIFHFIYHSCGLVFAW